VVQVGDLAGEPAVRVVVEAEPAVADVAGDELDARAVDRVGRRAGRAGHPLLDQRGDTELGIAVEQTGDEAAGDEAGEPGDEGMHGGAPAYDCPGRRRPLTTREGGSMPAP
jgi:hypothetical protein